MDDFKYFKEIEAFHEGQMPAEDKKSFEEKLAKDEVLKKEYKAYKAALIASEILGFQELKSHTPGSGAKVRSLARLLAIAASFLFLVLATGLIYANLNYRSSQLLSDIAVPTQIDLSSEKDSKVQNAWQAFQEKDYGQSIQLSAPERGESGEQSLAMKKLYAFSLVNYEQSEAALSLLLALDQEEEDVQWYLAKAYLLTGQKQEGKRILVELANKGDEQAQRLRKDLNSFWANLVW